jgi:homoserine dehydrogenase
MRIVLLGFGVVGRSFAEIVMSEGPKIAKEYGLRPKVVGIVDSKGAALDENGLDLANRRRPEGTWLPSGTPTMRA